MQISGEKVIVLYQPYKKVIEAKLLPKPLVYVDKENGKRHVSEPQKVEEGYVYKVNEVYGRQLLKDSRFKLISPSSLYISIMNKETFGMEMKEVEAVKIKKLPEDNETTESALVSENEALKAQIADLKKGQKPAGAVKTPAAGKAATTL